LIDFSRNLWYGNIPLQSIADTADSSDPFFGTGQDESGIVDLEARCFSYDAVDSAFGSDQRSAFWIRFIPPLKVGFGLRIELITAIETGAMMACENLLLMEDRRFVRLVDELRRV
jgi:hypothetical protein